MESKLIISTLLVTLLLALINGVNCLQCYECNSAFDKNCDDIALQPPVSVKSYLKNCTLPPHAHIGDEPLCRRIEFTTLQGEHRIVRTCGWIKSHQACAKLDSFDLAETSCQCFEDRCNGSSFIGGSVSTILFVSLTAIMLRNWFRC